MFQGWKIIFKHYFFTDSFEKETSKDRNGFILLCFLFLGFISSIGLINKGEAFYSQDAISKKILLTKNNLDILEKENLKIQSELFILNYKLTQTLEEKEKIELKKIARLAGSENVKSEGIIIRLLDNKDPLINNENPNDGIIHDFDIVKIINDLWTLGATAVSINGNRVTSQTKLKCIGPTILLDKTRIAQPFEIRAAGNSRILSQGMEKGYLHSLKIDGIRYFIEKYDYLHIPADKSILTTGGI